MLSVSLKGGLGNVLFCVAAGEHFAAAAGRALVFETETTPPTQHADTDYFATLLKPWARTAPLGWRALVTETTYEYTDFAAAARALPPHVAVHLDGYFQNYRYIPPDFPARLALPLAPPVDAAFVHVRGGDYVGHWLHHVDLRDYYTRARALFPAGTRFLGFTNDPAYARTLPALADVEWVDCPRAEDALAAMAACTRGGICPNSTFAWWAAYLQRARGYGLQVLPSQWFLDGGRTHVGGYFFPGAVVLDP